MGLHRAIDLPSPTMAIPLEKWTPKWSAWNDRPRPAFLPISVEAQMSDIDGKSDSGRGLPAPEHDKDRDQKKKPGEGVPDFDRAATDPDVIKHVGP